MRKHLAIHDRENIDDGHKVAEGHEITNASESSTYSVPDFVPITNHPCRHCQVTFSIKRDLLTHLVGHAEINSFYCLVRVVMQDFLLRKSLPSMNGNYMESNIVVLIVGEFVFQPLNWKIYPYSYRRETSQV